MKDPACKRCGEELTVHTPTVIAAFDLCVWCATIILSNWQANGPDEHEYLKAS